MISTRLTAALSVALCTSITTAIDVEPADKLVASPLRAGTAITEHITQLHIDPALMLAAKETAKTNDQFRIGGFPIPGNESVELILQSMQVFAPDSVIEIADHNGIRNVNPPEVTFLHGSAKGVEDSQVFLAFTPAGIDGWIRLNDIRYDISDGNGKALSIHRLVDQKPMAIEGFCNADRIMQPKRKIRSRPAAEQPSGGIAGFGSPGDCRRMRIAIDTDEEYLQMFGGDVNQAIGYTATLMAGASVIYTRDVNTRLELSYLRLWNSTDPWNQPSTGDQLYEFRDYWEGSKQSVERDLAHFLSGRGLGGGVAWLGVICDSSFNYGLSANLGGAFPYPIENNDGGNWDLMVFSHELGHNFGAPHTHDLTPQVDNCAGGDCSIVPNATVMSYCHLCDGGLANVRMEFCPENIAIMNNFLSETCDFTVDPNVLCIDDFATVSNTQSQIIDVLQNDITVGCDLAGIESHDVVGSQGGIIERVSDWGEVGYEALRYTAPEDFTGIEIFEYQGRSGNVTDTGVVTIEIGDGPSLRPADNPVGTTPGVLVEYYATEALSTLPDFTTLTPFASEVVPNIEYPSTNGPFMNSGLNDDVAAVFTGWVAIPTDGFWTFGTNSDDGSALYIGDEQVVNNDGTHGMVERIGSIGLEAGVHSIRVEFFERGGGAGLFVLAGGPDYTYEVISADLWFNGGNIPGSSDLNGDGLVNGADLGLLLAAWGTCDGCPEDINGDGFVTGADLGLMLSDWAM